MKDERRLVDRDICASRSVECTGYRIQNTTVASSSLIGKSGCQVRDCWGVRSLQDRRRPGCVQNILYVQVSFAPLSILSQL